MKRRTNDDYIRELKEKKPYLVSLEPYVGVLTKIKHKCLVCGYGSKGEWKVTPNQLLNSSCGCPRCGHRKQGKDREKGTAYYLAKVKSLVGNEYTVRSANINTKHKITITHNRCLTGGHHTYCVSISKFLTGRRCPECAKVLRREHTKYTNDKVDAIINKVLGEKYKRLSNYVDNETPMEILHTTCNKHISRSLREIVDGHLGCYYCHNISKGEANLLDIFDSLSVSYEYQKTFKGCKDKLALPFDFYLPGYNMCIEYDGIQHHNKNSLFYSEVGEYHDNLKNLFCRQHRINLVRISYKVNTYIDLKNYIIKLLGLNNNSEIV